MIALDKKSTAIGEAGQVIRVCKSKQGALGLLQLKNSMAKSISGKGHYEKGNNKSKAAGYL